MQMHQLAIKIKLYSKSIFYYKCFNGVNTMELKPFLLNPIYKFDLNGNYKIGDQDTIFDDSELLSISIENKNWLLNKKWLGLISHYEVNLPFKDIVKIDFASCSSRVIGLKCKSMMIIKTPIVFENSFRVIPGFTGFIIDKLGTVKSRKTGRILKKNIGPYGYPYVNIYDADKPSWRAVSVHILLARAFISNKNPEHYCYINHKDGNKLNYKLSNLEWISSRNNNLHAVNNNLRKDNSPCHVRDIETEKIEYFASIGQAMRYIGLEATNMNIGKKVGENIIPHLAFGRYEIKLINDKRDWYYSKENCKDIPILSGPYQAYCVNTKTVTEAKSVKELSNKINLSESTVFDMLKSIKPRSCKGYIVRVKCDAPWENNHKEIVYNPARKIIARNLDTNEVLYFKSIRSLSASIPIDKRTLKAKLISKKSHFGWVFEEET